MYLPVMSACGTTDEWAQKCAEQVLEAINCPADKRAARYSLGLQHARTFNTDIALDQYAAVYSQVLDRVD
jgi:hypothetical protein